MMTTISIERLLMESKNKMLQDYNINLRRESNRLFRRYIITKRRLKELNKITHEKSARLKKKKT